MSQGPRTSRVDWTSLHHEPSERSRSLDRNALTYTDKMSRCPPRVARSPRWMAGNTCRWLNGSRRADPTTSSRNVSVSSSSFHCKGIMRRRIVFQSTHQ
jgi:hypothetical protein